MALYLLAQRNRTIVLSLVVLGVAFEAVAAGLAVGGEWFSTFGVPALVGPLLLVVPAYLVRARSSAILLVIAAITFASVAGLALLLAAITPLAALGPLLVLSFVWVLGIAVIVCVTLMERLRHA